MSEIEAFYDKHAEREWDRLERHRTEFAVTLLALQDHLPSVPARILDEGRAFGAWVVLNHKLGKDLSAHGTAEHLLCVSRKQS